jgi:type II secretory pathway pseudopilin PulG
VPGLSSLRQPVVGMVLVEVLVALLLFSVAISGSLQTQLRALGSTQANLAQAQATRLLQDLTQRGAAVTLAGLAPTSLPLSPTPATVAPGPLRDWLTVVPATGSALGPAALCIAWEPDVLRLSIERRDPRMPASGDCDDGGRALASMVLVP